MKQDNSIRRILLTTDTVGGIWTYSVSLCRQYLEMNVSVILATMGKRLSASQWKQVLQLSNVFVCESEFKLEWMDDPWDDVDKAGEWLMHLEDVYEPEVIHLNSYSFAVLPFRAPVLLVCHSCVLSWWQSVKGSGIVTNSLQTYFERVSTGIHTADQLIAVSHAHALQISSIYDIDPEEILVIHNGLFPTDYCPSKKKDKILGVGRVWDEAKNFGILDDIAGKLRWPIELAGSTTTPVTGESFTANNLTLLGELSRDEVHQALEDAAIYVLPAKYEPFGLSVLEAAFSGCALILADIETFRELWDDAAIFISPDDPQAWHDHLQMLIANPVMRHQLSTAAFIRAHNFTIQESAKLYLSVYNREYRTKHLYI